MRHRGSRPEGWNRAGWAVCGGTRPIVLVERGGFARPHEGGAFRSSEIRPITLLQCYRVTRAHDAGAAPRQAVGKAPAASIEAGDLV